MKVLLTGAFGNLGSLILEKLLEQGHDVTAFDLGNKVNRKMARPYQERAKIVWGDIRDQEKTAQLVQGQDAVIHVAAIIYPFSEAAPELAKAVNVGGTETLLRAVEKSERDPVFVFASSISVFGLTQDLPPPRKPEDEVLATDHYSAHKIACEKMIQQSQANWSILRIGAMVDSRLRQADKAQLRAAFRVAADNRVEFVHPKDAATAFVNAATRPEALRKILLIGGGDQCQVMHHDLVNVVTSAFGFAIPAEHFGQVQLYTDWLDTTDSQRILAFQQRSFADLQHECHYRFRWLRPFTLPLRPLVVPLLVRMAGH